MLCLPYEIERKVFRLAAHVHPASDVRSCLLVAQRVQNWTEGLIYHTIVLTSETRACRFIDSLHSRPALASKNVKSLCLCGTVQLATAAEVMHLCSGVCSLALWILPEGHNHTVPDFLLEELNGLPLSRLSIQLSTVFRRTARPFLPSIPIFNIITHLELLEGWVLWGSSIGIPCLTQLTHISLRVFTKQTAPALLQMILSDCVILEVLVLRVTEEVGTVEKWLLEYEGLDDPRIVVTTKSPHDTWDHVASDGMSLWQYGDYVAKCQSATHICTID
ncbi:hypothetical protein C8R48DRAFT_781495 [Suillus tomentosus]|nr:hypothetical protein C8R48DRAFT_781495 [Suillus tomentosus]